MGGNLLIVDSCAMQGVLTLHGDHGWFLESSGQGLMSPQTAVSPGWAALQGFRLDCWCLCGPKSTGPRPGCLAPRPGSAPSRGCECGQVPAVNICDSLDTKQLLFSCSCYSSILAIFLVDSDLTLRSYLFSVPQFPRM